MNKNNKIQYSKCYIAFLDILGFKKLVNSNLIEDKQKIIDYFNLIKEVTEGSKNDIGSIIISDSVILHIKISTETTENIRKLRELCITIQKIQFKLAENNIWLRGGISSGEAYFSAQDSQVVGPAYIKAYLLEENIALNPRVILDNILINELNLNSAEELIEKINNIEVLGEYSAETSNILFHWTYTNILKKGLKKDIPLFVDYLVYAFTEESKLERIIKNIEETIYSDNALYSKFRWVADYLLASCQYYNDYMPSKIDKNVLLKQHKRLDKL